VVINTVFQQADKHKRSWIHPRSGHWHLINFVLTRQRDLRNISLTRAIRATTSWSDHRIVRTSVFLTTKAVKRTHKALLMKRLNVAKLKDEATCLALQEQLDQALSGDDTSEWSQFKSAVYDSAVTVIRFSKSRHRDWFDDEDAEVRHGSTTKTIVPKRLITPALAAQHRKDSHKRMVGQQSPRVTTSSRLEGHEDFLPRTESSVRSPVFRI